MSACGCRPLNLARVKCRCLLLQHVIDTVGPTRKRATLPVLEDATALSSTFAMIQQSHHKCVPSLSLTAAEVLASGVHRLLVTNKARDLTGICSQSDIVRFLATAVFRADPNPHLTAMRAPGSATSACRS